MLPRVCTAIPHTPHASNSPSPSTDPSMNPTQQNSDARTHPAPRSPRYHHHRRRYRRPPRHRPRPRPSAVPAPAPPAPSNGRGRRPQTRRAAWRRTGPWSGHPTSPRSLCVGVGGWMDVRIGWSVDRSGRPRPNPGQTRLCSTPHHTINPKTNLTTTKRTLQLELGPRREHHAHPVPHIHVHVAAARVHPSWLACSGLACCMYACMSSVGVLTPHPLCVLLVGLNNRKRPASSRPSSRSRHGC